MTFKDFLEKAPIYSLKEIEGLTKTKRLASFHGPVSFQVNQVDFPALMMYCSRCKDRTTFNVMSGGQLFAELGLHTSQKHLAGTTFHSFTCRGCNSAVQEYYLRAQVLMEGENATLKVIKIGQYPELQMVNEAEMRQLLDGDDFELYKKGFRCESSAYGIGAYGYYRQLVEDKIDFILDTVDEGADAETKTLVAEARTEKNTTRKIEIIKDKIPEKLKSGGHNPLSLLHTSLSAGLHGWTDEECLAEAEKIRTALVVLLKNIRKDSEEKGEIAKVFGDLANS